MIFVFFAAWEAKKPKKREALVALDGLDAEMNALLTRIQKTALKVASHPLPPQAFIV